MTKPIWDARKSVTLSMVVTGVGLVTALGCVVGLIPLLRTYQIDTMGLTDSFIARAAGPLYACLAIGIIALIVLMRLLWDIRRGEVFTLANVRRLRLISYCGFAIMAACAVGAIIAADRPVFILLGAIAGFLGLLMRVVKNVIDAARLLKEDSDFTI